MYEIHNGLNFLFRATVIPGLFLIVWLTGLVSLATVQISIFIFLIVFVIFPLVFRYSIRLQRGILFLTFITYPKDLNLADPSSVGLYGTRNFKITVDDGDVEENDGKVHVGVWHVLPANIVKSFAEEFKLSEPILHKEFENVQAYEGEQLEMITVLKSEFPTIVPENEALLYERLLKIPSPIVLYLHGNTASRGSGHRVDIYKVLSKLGYHVFSLDYRGYGDSDKVAPTEEGVVQDALAVYKYIRSVTTNPIFIWGHSLGTGVSTRLCAQLDAWHEKGPRGVILESPFTNIRDEIREHPFARPFKHLPWFDLTIARPMYSNALRFESDRHISSFRQPVLILHAEDDYVVPFSLGYKLYRIALDTRGRSFGPVEFHRFEGSRHYGHKFICLAPELPEIISNFVNKYSRAVY